MLQALAGFDPKDPGSAQRPVPDYSAAFVPDLKGWRIGVVRHFWEEDLPASDEERSSAPAKKKIAYAKWRGGLARMRRAKLIPQGTGRPVSPRLGVRGRSGE